VRLTTPPRKKILLRNLKRRPRPTQGCRADDDDDDDDDKRERFTTVCTQITLYKTSHTEDRLSKIHKIISQKTFAT
jgi:hypothetical protein